MSDKIAVRYIGNGFIPGIPARDLSVKEAKEFGGVEYLVSTGLYAIPDKAPVQVQESEK